MARIVSPLSRSRALTAAGSVAAVLAVWASAGLAHAQDRSAAANAPVAGKSQAMKSAPSPRATAGRKRYEFATATPAAAAAAPTSTVPSVAAADPALAPKPKSGCRSASSDA